jgi:hypothetical protein
MKRLIPALFALTAIVASAQAQQTGNAQRDYSINGVGAGGTSPVLQSIGVPGTRFSNLYTTQQPNMPVLWASAPTQTNNWLPLQASSVDVGPMGLTFLLNGTDPSTLFSPFAVTDGAGTFEFTLNTSVGLVGLTLYFAFAHVAPGSPDGFYVSQTHGVSWVQDPNLGVGNPTCSPPGLSVTLTDDSFAQQSLGFTFNFFGAGWTECFVGSNGHVTFSSGDSGWAFDPLSFQSGPPRIATLSEDLNPAVGGTVSFLTDNVGYFETCFAAVPSYASNNINNFKTTCINGTGIVMDYGQIDDTDGLVGLCPGNGAGTLLPINISTGANLIGPGMVPYENFESFNAMPNDLQNTQVIWILDATGTPFQQL